MAIYYFTGVHWEMNDYILFYRCGLGDELLCFISTGVDCEMNYYVLFYRCGQGDE